MSRQFSVSVVIGAVDKATAPIRKITRALEAFKKVEGIQRTSVALGRVRDSFKGVLEQASRFAVGMGALGGAGLFAFKALFLDTALQFEKFQTILNKLEGSKDKAKKSMDWISNFAATTPYDLKEVTDAFVKLRAYGMNPQAGLMKGLGDASAAMGKSFMQSVEMIADAVTGENERLKEFGIKARAVGKKFVYEYTENGKTMKKTALKSSREQIQATLLSIFNSKYAGAMNDLSHTFGGMLSNLGDQWTRLSMMVMNEGLFNFLTGELKTLMDNINKLMVDPAFIAQVKSFAKDLKQLFIELKSAVVEVWPVFIQFITAIGRTAHAMGGYGNVLKVVTALMASPLIASIISAVGAIGSLAVTFVGFATSAETAWAALGVWIELCGGVAAAIAFLSTPVGWITGAIALIGASAAILAANWKPLSAWFTGMWQQWGGLIRLLFPPIGWIVDAAELIMQNWGPISSFFSSILSTIGEAFQIAGTVIGDIFDGLKSGAMGLLDVLKKVAGALPNKNVFSGKQSLSVQAGSIKNGKPISGISPKMGPPISIRNNQNATQVVAIKPKKDELHVALKVDVTGGGKPSIAGIRSRGDSVMRYSYDLGPVTG